MNSRKTFFFFWLSTSLNSCKLNGLKLVIKLLLGVATLAGRKSILKLAQRMTWSFCHAIGASSCHTWTKVTSKTGEDIRISSRKNLNDPGEPLGLILCAVSSVWLPVSPNVLFDFLRDEAHRTEVPLLLIGFLHNVFVNLMCNYMDLEG